ncbi:MAG: hypothetical protein QXM08_03150 [Thermofilaceae archaeon]
MKDLAKRILSDVSQGRERVMTTVVHLSEVVNIPKHGIPAEELTFLLFLDCFRGVADWWISGLHHLGSPRYFRACENEG